MSKLLSVLASLTIIASAFAADAPRIDLDRPGALDQLKLEHPQRYQAVSAVLHASKRAPCEGDEIKLLETRLSVRDLECGMTVSTTFPAQRHVSFELDGASYAATVVLEDSSAVQPVSTVTGQPAAH
jgi:hypothetical protein